MTYIDVIILTHPDADHYYGALEVIKRFKVGKIFLTGALKDDPKYLEIFTLAQEKNIELVFASAQTDFSLDGVLFDVISPFTPQLGNSEAVGNNFSLVFLLSYKEKKILFTGDMETPTEEQLLQSGQDIRADILKVPHHGSKSSSSESFLKAVNPSRAIVQVGTQNPFGHPHQPVIERYKKLSIPFDSTKYGDIVVEW